MVSSDYPWPPLMLQSFFSNNQKLVSIMKPRILNSMLGIMGRFPTRHFGRIKDRGWETQGPHFLLRESPPHTHTHTHTFLQYMHVIQSLLYSSVGRGVAGTAVAAPCTFFPKKRGGWPPHFEIRSYVPAI